MWLIAFGVITAVMVQASYVSVPKSCLADIEESCRLAGLSMKQVAAIYGVGPDQFYQQCRGQGHLSVWRLIAMKDDPDGRRFLAHYIPRLWEAFGMPPIKDFVALREVMGRIVDQIQVEMGRSELAERDEEGVA